MSSPNPSRPDPTEEETYLRPIRLLFDAMDADIARLYDERAIEGIRPRYVGPLIKLAQRGPMRIRHLAEAFDVTHSAMSQTVSALRKEGYIRSVPGTDARTREIGLTERARELIPFLEAEWRATEQAAAELDAEIPYSLNQVVRDMEAALERRSFHDRILEKLVEPESESPEQSS